MPKFITWLMEWFLNTQIWVRLARHQVAYFTFRLYGYPKFPMEKYFEIEAILKNNQDPDCFFGFVAADQDSLSWKLTHAITKAAWGHAGYLYIDPAGHIRCSHMKGDGLNNWNVLDILRESDCFAVLKYKLKPGFKDVLHSRLKAIETAPTVQYDYTMSLDSDIPNWLAEGIPMPSGEKPFNIYCSEYVYVLGHSITEPSFVAKDYEDRLVFEPDDAYHAGEVVFEYRYKKSN